MESKPNPAGLGFETLELLIEPVWNRNLFGCSARRRVQRLLIEPVWNRNRIRFDSKSFPVNLLIEPVWNRNVEVARRNGVSLYRF